MIMSDEERTPVFEHEKLFANVLESCRVKYKYEGVTFKLPNPHIKYTPDFYLPKEGVYLELSNTRQAYHQSKKKIEKVIAIYQNIAIRVIIYNGHFETYTNMPYVVLNTKTDEAIYKAIDICWPNKPHKYTKKSQGST